MARKSNESFFDARGRLTLERRGLPRDLGSTLANDAYHLMRTATWTQISLMFVGGFALINLGFALVYWWTDSVANARGLADCYWFSVQTLATIGYGLLSPRTDLGNLLVTVESFCGIGFTALATGVFFARFSTPSARVIFSNVAVIGTYDGKRTLMFRMANARATTIIEATVNVYLSRDEVTADGERVRRILDLRLHRNVTPTFALTWTAYHTIDETSPLHGLRPGSMERGAMNLIVTFQGIDDRLASTVHTRWSYNIDDLVFDHRFADVIKRDDKTGVRYLDFTQFHAIEPCKPAAPTGVLPP